MDLRPAIGHRLKFCTLYCLWYKHLLWLKKVCWFDFTMLFTANFALEIQIGILGFLSFRTPMPTKTALGIQQCLGISETRVFWILNRSTSWHVCWSACQVARVTRVLLPVWYAQCMYQVTWECVLGQKNCYKLPGSDILLMRISGLYFTLKLWLLDTVAF